MAMGSGLLEYMCFDTFSCIIIYNVKVVDRIVINHGPHQYYKLIGKLNLKR